MLYPLALPLAIALVRYKYKHGIENEYEAIINDVLQTLKSPPAVSNKAAKRPVVSKPRPPGPHIVPLLRSKYNINYYTPGQQFQLPPGVPIENAMSMLKFVYRWDNLARNNRLIEALVNYIVEDLNGRSFVRIGIIRSINECTYLACIHETHMNKYVDFKLSQTTRLLQSLLHATNFSITEVLRDNIFRIILASKYKNDLLSIPYHSKSIKDVVTAYLACNTWKPMKLPIERELCYRLISYNTVLLGMYKRDTDTVVLALLIQFDNPRILTNYRQFLNSSSIS